MVASLGIDELRGHPQPGFVALYTAFEQVARIEPAPDRAHVLATGIRGERGGARNHCNVVQIGKLVQDGLGNSESKQCVTRLGAQVLEWQDRNRAYRQLLGWCPRRLRRGR